jgi:hypothetical protein
MVEPPKDDDVSPVTLKDWMDISKRVSAEERFKSIGVWDDLTMMAIGSEEYTYASTTAAGADEATAMSWEMLKEMTKKLEDPTPPKSSSEMYFAEQEALMEKFKEAGATAKRIQNLIQEAPIDPTPLEHNFSFELSAPLSVTVGQLARKSSFGFTKPGHINWFMVLAKKGEIKAYTEYKKLPMIGGEKFRPIDAYVGKSGKCFIRFIETPPESEIRTLTNQQYVEFDYETALNVLSGFSEYISNAFHVLDDKVGEDGLAAVLEDFKLAANKLYGSW